MGSHCNLSCNCNGTQDHNHLWDQNSRYLLHICNSFFSEQLHTSRYQLPNQEPLEGFYCFVDWLDKLRRNWTLSLWIIKAKLHGLKDQTSLWLLKLYAAKLILLKPLGISIWQHPIPEQLPFTILCVLLVHLDRQPMENGSSLRTPLRYA